MVVASSPRVAAETGSAAALLDAGVLVLARRKLPVRWLPQPGGGPVDRPAGTVDEDAKPPLSDPDDDTEYGGTGTLPPKDNEAAVPPYEGRT